MSELQESVRVRFAPSPTGNLHIGGARTAIYNWAFARRHGGSFILRIEDTDPERSTPENTAQIMRSLRWLGLEWDEGPEVGGAFGPYLQTERNSTYGEALEQLKQRDAVYPCFCTPEELAVKREQAMSEKAYAGYDRSCRRIPVAQAQARIAAGEPHTWRLKVPLDRGDVAFEDEVYGLTTVPITQLDDLILVRSDGTPTYNFAVCVDDTLMRITHVIRGDDHMSNTPKQILIYEALGTRLPSFAHLSMILGSDGKRLSKRHGATSVEAYQNEGYFPEALVNYLALLGWSLDGETTIISAETLCASFSLDRVSKNPAIFDEAKLAWMNQAYLKAMGAEAFVEALEPFLVDCGFMRGKGPTVNLGGAYTLGALADPAAIKADIAENKAWYEAIHGLIAERAKTMTDVIPMIAYLFGGDTVELDPVSMEKCLFIDGASGIFDSVILALEEVCDWKGAKIENALRQVPEKLGIKAKPVFQAVRVAVCGTMVSPPLFESLELIGKDDVLSRLKVSRDILGWRESFS
ncbi:MAG: glutamate--tRNA ligase [Coriobacteriia bacterium]|nr:glutamate--tRNA ligase [Coriobacteriia bacterium]